MHLNKLAKEDHKLGFPRTLGAFRLFLAMGTTAKQRSAHGTGRAQIAWQSKRPWRSSWRVLCAARPRPVTIRRLRSIVRSSRKGPGAGS
jgi:hypothetical protein